MPKFYNCIEYDDIEDRYIGLYGEQYNTMEDIPFKYRHLVKPIKPVKKIKTKTPSNPRKFFLLALSKEYELFNGFRGISTTIGHALVKPYFHSDNLWVRYEYETTYKPSKEEFNDMLMEGIMQQIKPKKIKVFKK